MERRFGQVKANGSRYAGFRGSHLAQDINRVINTGDLRADTGRCGEKVLGRKKFDLDFKQEGLANAYTDRVFMGC